MRFLALAADYDGTLATNGQVDEATLAALKCLRESGRKLLLVSGRHLDDLCTVFEHVDLFDCVVVENGALLYIPTTKEEQVLGDRPPEAFIQALQTQNVNPLGVGKVIVSTWEPHETTVLQVIRDLGLELQVIFNKGAVMVLPSGVNKASGLSAALMKLELSPHNAVSIGDAENDHAMLSLCEVSVAVANALPMVKERVDWVTQGCRGAGVIELIERLIASDLQDMTIDRHKIVMGVGDDEQEVYLQPNSTSVLLAGTSGGGKSTLATGILERLAQQGYQFCIIDPEGDYESFEGAVVLGDGNQKPNITEVMDLLSQPQQNVIINLLAVKLEERPAFLSGLLPLLLELRSRTGRPHWIVVDEAHHMLPASWNPASLTLPQTLNGIMLITVHPDQVAVPALALVDTIVAIGKAPDVTISSFCTSAGHCPPNPIASKDLPPGEAMAWFCRTNEHPVRFQICPPKGERQRHKRNYAEGQLGDDKCFYFRGADGKLNLKAQNLMMFVQLAEGVDEDTWLYHLHQQDYSHWFQEAIKDDELAADVADIEKQSDISARESRDLVKAALLQRYTLPA
ncbi:HAD-IIB family hydrolase [Nostoc sp. CHAB 5844]|nr:HAD-IIB family hydrolase [Nostoc sp. CHAB 5844]